MLAGTVFDPSDQEIVSHYLPKLIEGESMGECQYLIEFYDIYSTKPSLLFDINTGKGLPFMKSNQIKILLQPPTEDFPEECKWKTTQKGCRKSWR